MLFRYFLAFLIAFGITTKSGGEFNLRSTGNAYYGSSSSGRAYSLSFAEGLFYHNGDTGGQLESSDQERNSTGNVGVHSRISRFISYRESTYSPTADRWKIKNVPVERQLSVMRHAGVNFFDPLRIYYGNPLFITSFFRSKLVNEKVGGSFRSHHMVEKDVCAIDIDMDGHRSFDKQGKLITNRDLFYHIRNHRRFHTLIWELGTADKPDWVHVAYSTDESKNNQRNVYRAIRQNGKTIYINF